MPDYNQSGEHNQLERSMGRLEGKVDTILTHIASMETSLGVQNGRIRLLEDEKNRQKGIMVAVAIVGGVVSQIGYLIVNKLWRG